MKCTVACVCKFRQATPRHGRGGPVSLVNVVKVELQEVEEEEDEDVDAEILVIHIVVLA